MSRCLGVTMGLDSRIARLEGDSAPSTQERFSLVTGFLIACRPKQWVKNVFVLTPLPFLLADGGVKGLANLGIIFAAYCMAASSVYLFNDVHDADRDRAHYVKSRRPVAAGSLPIKAALIGTALLALVSSAIGMAINPQVLICVVAYLVLGHLYTVVGKHVPLLDIALVGSFYSLRVLAGFSAASLFPTEWFAWLVLAGLLVMAGELGKRKSERQRLGNRIDTRLTLAFYSDMRVTILYLLISSIIVATYPIAALSVATGFVLSTVLVVAGLIRFWLDLKRLCEDTHPQEVILHDWVLVAILVMFSLSLVTTVISTRS